MKSTALVTAMTVLLVPMASHAQERMKCSEYLKLETEARLAALEVVKT